MLNNLIVVYILIGCVYFVILMFGHPQTVPALQRRPILFNFVAVVGTVFLWLPVTIIVIRKIRERNRQIAIIKEMIRQNDLLKGDDE